MIAGSRSRSVPRFRRSRAQKPKPVSKQQRCKVLARFAKLFGKSTKLEFTPAMKKTLSTAGFTLSDKQLKAMETGLMHPLLSRIAGREARSQLKTPSNAKPTWGHVGGIVPASPVNTNGPLGPYLVTPSFSTRPANEFDKLPERTFASFSSNSKRMIDP